MQLYSYEWCKKTRKEMMMKKCMKKWTKMTNFDEKCAKMVDFWYYCGQNNFWSNEKLVEKWPKVTMFHQNYAKWYHFWHFFDIFFPSIAAFASFCLLFSTNYIPHIPSCANICLHHFQNDSYYLPLHSLYTRHGWCSANMGFHHDGRTVVVDKDSYVLIYE